MQIEQIKSELIKDILPACSSKVNESSNLQNIQTTVFSTIVQMLKTAYPEENFEIKKKKNP